MCPLGLIHEISRHLTHSVQSNAKKLIKRPPVILENITVYDPAKGANFYSGKSISNTSPEGIWTVKLPTTMNKDDAAPRALVTDVQDVGLMLLLGCFPEVKEGDYQEFWH